MAEATPDLEKLISLQRQRPSYSRMISWELSEAATRSPPRKARQKKKRHASGDVFSSGDGKEVGDDIDEEAGEVMSDTGSDHSSDYETAEEEMVGVTESLAELSYSGSSCDSLNDSEIPDFLTCSTASTSTQLGGQENVDAFNGKTTTERRRRLSKKQKRKKREVGKTTYLQEMYNLGNLCDMSQDIEDVFDNVSEVSPDIVVQRRVPSLVEICLSVARRKPRSNSERAKKTQAALQQSQSELPWLIKSQIRNYGRSQSDQQKLLSYLQNQVLPISSYMSCKEYLKRQCRSVFSLLPQFKCTNCTPACENSSVFLFHGSMSSDFFDEANLSCYGCFVPMERGRAHMVCSINALATAIDLMLPCQLLNESSENDWKADNRFKNAIFRVKRALKLRYEVLIETMFDIALPYVMWARGYVAIATEMFKSLMDKEEECDMKAMYLSEIAKMNVHFGDSTVAARFYRLACETSLDSVATCQEAAINESLEQQQILLASVYDTGLLDTEKAELSSSYWGCARHLKKRRVETAIASMDSFLCYHATHWKATDWLEESMKKIEASKQDVPYLIYYQSMLYALQGLETESLDKYRECRQLNFTVPGAKVLSLLGRQCKYPWQPIVNMIKGQGSLPNPLKVVWRAQLGHPIINRKGTREAQVTSPELKLRLNDSGHVTGNMQMLMPPLRDVAFDPYNGSLQLTNIPAYTGTWQSSCLPADHSCLMGLPIPTPALVYSNDDGTTVHLICPSKVAMIETERRYANGTCSPPAALLVLRDKNGRTAKLDLLNEVAKKHRDVLLEKGKNLANGNEEELVQCYVESAYTRRYHRNDHDIKQFLQRKRKAIKKIADAEKLGKKVSKRDKRMASNYVDYVNTNYLLLELKHEPFVFGKTIVFWVNCSQQYLIFVNTESRESFLQCKLWDLGNENGYEWMTQGRNNRTDEDFFMVFSSQFVDVFNQKGERVENVGNEFSDEWHKQKTTIIGSQLFARNKEQNSLVSLVIGAIDEETSYLSDYIVWTIAPYVVELTANDPEPPRITDTVTVGKARKFMLLVLDRALGIMCLQNMECLEISTADQCVLGFDLTEDGRLMKGNFEKFMLFEEHNFEHNSKDVTRLCIGCDNKLLLVDIAADSDGQFVTVTVQICLNLPGIPTEMCFVGKQALLVSITQHDKDSLNYREHVLHFDLLGHLHGYLLCLGNGPRSFFPVYLHGDEESGEGREAGWRVYLSDGRGGILCLKLD